MSIYRTYPIKSCRNGDVDSDKHKRIQREIEDRVWETASGGPRAIDRRLRELDDEFDIDRLLKLQAGSFALKFLLFGAIVSKKYYWGAALVGALILEQQMQGWSPPYALYRKLGKRTAEEIDEERCALENLRE